MGKTRYCSNVKVATIFFFSSKTPLEMIKTRPRNLHNLKYELKPIKNIINMEDDYFIDDDENLDEDGLYQPPDDEDDEDEDEESSPDEEIYSPKVTVKSYEGKMTSKEIWLCGAYDDIVAAGKKSKDTSIVDAVTTVVMANPEHTSTATVGSIVKEMFHAQGHSRMVNSIYTPDTPLTGEDVDLDFIGEDDSGFNKFFAQEARNQIARFIDYLANRDLSKDDVYSVRRKRRHIPAFIIFLFSSGMYDLIINCPTMPAVYKKQINRALEKILEAKYDIVEDLAKRYEEVGRPAVADRVRKLQLAWFLREPAEIRTLAAYSDLDITYDDVVIYREYRNKFTNLSKAITQEVISDLIEVVLDEDAGVYEKLKDKTRSEAIADVKQVYKTWARENSGESELANKVIWKDI